MEAILQAEQRGNDAYSGGQLDQAIEAFKRALELIKSSEAASAKVEYLLQQYRSAGITKSIKDDQDDEKSEDMKSEDMASTTTAASNEDRTRESNNLSMSRASSCNEEQEEMLNLACGTGIGVQVEDDEKAEGRELSRLKGQILVALANCHLDVSQSYSAHKVASEAVRTLTAQGLAASSESRCSARLIRARAITYMERRDEMYYDTEEEHTSLIAEAVTDLHAVVHQEPTNQAAKNELAFLEHVTEKAAAEAMKGQRKIDAASRISGRVPTRKVTGSGYEPPSIFSQATVNNQQRPVSRSNSDGNLGALRSFIQKVETSNDAGAASGGGCFGAGEVVTPTPRGDRSTNNYTSTNSLYNAATTCQPCSSDPISFKNTLGPGPAGSSSTTPPGIESPMNMMRTSRSSTRLQSHRNTENTPGGVGTKFTPGGGGHGGAAARNCSPAGYGGTTMTGGRNSGTKMTSAMKTSAGSSNSNSTVLQRPTSSFAGPVDPFGAQKTHSSSAFLPKRLREPSSEKRIIKTPSKSNVVNNSSSRPRSSAAAYLAATEASSNDLIVIREQSASQLNPPRSSAATKNLSKNARLAAAAYGGNMVTQDESPEDSLRAGSSTISMKERSGSNYSNEAWVNTMLFERNNFR